MSSPSTWAPSAGACPTWRYGIIPSDTAATEDGPRLLFISPVYPDTQGNGLAMRAAMFVEALAQRHRVTLLVIPAFNSRTATADALIRTHCADEIVVPLQHGTARPKRIFQRRAARPSIVDLFEGHAQAAVKAVGARRFDVVHAFRLYTGRVALAIADESPGARPRLDLDLDDIGSATQARLAQVYHLKRRLDDEAKGRAETEAYREEEQQLLPRFGRVYVCSQHDEGVVAADVCGDIRVVPNAVRPPETLPARLTTHPFTFLFVGSLSYYPNEDAARYFCTEVLPVLRKQASRPLLVRIVGGGMPPELAELARAPEVRLVGYVDDLAREYGETDAVIVPVRAGGGTRIKVLEAFAYQRPVVSTSIGVEGIEVEPDRDYLQADTPPAFAEQCLRLMEDPALGHVLAGNAAALVAERYTQERVNQIVAGFP